MANGRLVIRVVHTGVPALRVVVGVWAAGRLALGLLARNRDDLWLGLTVILWWLQLPQPWRRRLLLLLPSLLRLVRLVRLVLVLLLVLRLRRRRRRRRRRLLRRLLLKWELM